MELLGEYASLVEEILRRELPDREPAALWKHVREYPFRGGKRLRPALVFLTAEMFGADREDAAEPAAAVELLHNFTLIHDDIEDHSRLRRGKPALHRMAGIELAINAGDALMAKAFELMARSAPRDAAARFGSVLVELAEGQAMDISWTLRGEIPKEDAILEMTEKKTGALIGFSLWLGARIAGKDVAALDRIGRLAGIAFQIRDDVLDLTGGERFGKERGRDIVEGKRTVILSRAVRTLGYGKKLELLGKLGSDRQGDVMAAIELLESCGAIEYAQKLAEKFAGDAIELARKELPDTPERHTLEQLIEFAVTRKR